MAQALGGKQPASEPVDDFEWINAGVLQAGETAGAPALAKPAPTKIASAISEIVGPARVIVPFTPAASPAGPLESAEQMAQDIILAQDIVAIENARARLAASSEPGPALASASGAITWRRTAEAVPVLLGGLIGSLMLVVFSIAALFVKMAR